MLSGMQEYLPALVPAVLGAGAFAIGMLFAVRERRERARLRSKQAEIERTRQLDPNLQKSA
jgi:hypothetical protein